MNGRPRLTVLAALLGLAGPAAAAGNLYCCADPSGKQVCGDILPNECVGKAYREIGPQGRTLRNVEAPKSPEERARAAAEEERKRIEEAARREQQRKDQALLNTYGNVQDIEIMRQRALDDVYKSIRNAETKIGEIRQQRKKFENEAEFYVKRPMPPEVRKGLSDTDFEIKAQESIIENKKSEIETIRAKYDDDRKRYLELMQRSSTR